MGGAPGNLGKRVLSIFDEARTELGRDGRATEKVSEGLADFLNTMATSSPEQLTELSGRFRNSSVSDGGTGLSNYVDFLLDSVVPHTMGVHSPRFVGHMTAPLPGFVHPVMQVITAINQNVVKVETSKVLTLIEREVLAKLHRLVFGLDNEFYDRNIQNIDSTLGLVVSGGTLANVAALWCARNRALPPGDGFAGVEEDGIAAALQKKGYRRAVIVGSSLMHYSLEKAACILGLGASALVRVKADADGRVSVSALSDRLEQCKRDGDRVIAVVGIAGTTETGAVDDLSALASLCEAHDTHFHVDAAWGGPTLFSDRHRTRLAGVERADSITIDGHKQLYLPIGIGMVLLRDPDTAKLIEKVAKYIVRAGSPDLGRRALEGSRPGLALMVHAGLSILGKDGYEFLIDHGIDRAQFLAGEVSRREDFELLADPQLNIVNYRFIPRAFRPLVKSGEVTPEINEQLNRMNQTLQEQLRVRGTSFISRTTLLHTHYGLDQAIVVLRAVLANPYTDDAELKSVLDEQGTVGTDVAKRLGL